MPESETLLKVLLVDDEPFITKGLAVLVDWNALGFAIEGAVSNGRQALTFLKKHPVDLIIADIQMPVMDGLELLEIIQRDHLSDAYFVILSGYSDFEYARQAIRFDCMEYLLKPVMTDQLIELLHKVRASCHRNSEGKKRDEAYGKAYLAQNLLALLQDRHDEKTVSFVKTQLRLNGGIRYVYIEAQTDPSEWVSAKQIKALRQNLAAKCREVLAGWEKHLLDAPPEQGGCGVGLIFCHGMAYETGQSEEDFLRTLQSRVQSSVQMPVALFAGEQTSHVTGLARSYQSSTRLRAVQKYLAKPIPVQIYQADMDAGEAGISAMALDSLIAAVEKSDKQGIRDAVPAVFGAIGADANFELLRINMDYLLYKLVRLACERDRAVNQMELLQHLQKNLLHHGGIISGKFERLTQFVQEYADYLSSLQRDGNDSILLRVEQDIRLHYKENLTLKELSRKYYVNSAYLGQLFKKKYGITFREYLNNCRIEQSAKLLLSTRDKVYNIAKAVGYQDMDYFIERFIAAKGCTPSNYRKTNGV